MLVRFFLTLLKIELMFIIQVKQNFQVKQNLIFYHNQNIIYNGCAWIRQSIIKQSIIKQSIIKQSIIKQSIIKQSIKNKA